MEHRQWSTSRQPVLSIVFYVLAALTGVLGVSIAIACFNAPGAFQAIMGLLPVPLLNLILPPLTNSLIILGIMALLGAAVVAALLIACGRLLARATTLARRVERIETALMQAELLPAGPLLDEAVEQVLDGVPHGSVHI